MLFLDLDSSAFNTIFPQHLTEKLSLLGVKTSLCNWTLGFLTSRPQSVWIRNNISNTASLHTGTPQGCVLSPLLFRMNKISPTRYPTLHPQSQQHCRWPPSPLTHTPGKRTWSIQAHTNRLERFLPSSLNSLQLDWTHTMPTRSLTIQSWPSGPLQPHIYTHTILLNCS